MKDKETFEEYVKRLNIRVFNNKPIEHQYTDFFNNYNLEKYIEKQMIESLLNPNYETSNVLTGTGTKRPRKRPITRNKRKHIKPNEHRTNKSS